MTKGEFIMQYRLLLLTLFLAVLSVNSACTKVTKDPNDSTPPVVEIKVRGADGQYKAATTASLSSTDGTLDLMCVVTDPQGVSYIAMNFSGMAHSCNVNGSVFSGTFPIIGLPSSQAQPINGDSSGKVPTSFALLSSLKGPLKCSILATPPQEGYPYGQKVTVQCSGKNWSENDQKKSAVATLDVTLK